MLKKLHKTLTARSNQDVVLIANGMFTNEGFPMEEAFVATNKANFQCETRNLDFSAPQQAAAEINQWVNNKTKGRSHRWRILHTKKEDFSLLGLLCSSLTVSSCFMGPTRIPLILLSSSFSWRSNAVVFIYID